MCLQLLQLAEQVQAHSCTSACASSLAAIEPGQLSVPFISDVLHLLASTTLESSIPQLEQLRDHCATRVLQLFADAVTVANDADLLAQFISLPFLVVQLWASSDQVQVDSENTVAWLLQQWWLHQWAAAAEDHVAALMGQMQQLSALIRVRQLGATCRLAILPSLPWFQPQKQLQQLSLLLHAPAGALSLDAPKLAFKDIPPAWLSTTARASSPSLEGGQSVLTLCVTAARLDAALAAAKAAGEEQDFDSDIMLARGYRCHLRLSITPNGEVGLHLRRAIKPQDWDCELEVLYDFALCSKAAATGAYTYKSRNHQLFVSPSSGRGCRDFFLVSPVSSSAGLARYLVDGQLWLKAAFKEVA